MKPLDLGTIAQLQNKAAEEAQKKQRVNIKNKQFPTEPRNYDTWWNLPTRFSDCSNEHCTDPRVNKEKTGKTMVAEVNGSDICRYCFLAGVNKITA